MEQQIYRQSKVALFISFVIEFLMVLFFYMVSHILGTFILILIIPIALVSIINYFRTIITLSEKHITFRKGIFTVEMTEIPYSKINTVSSSMGILGRQYDYGSIKIFTGNDVSGIVFRAIENVEGLKRSLKKVITD